MPGPVINTSWLPQRPEPSVMEGVGTKLLRLLGDLGGTWSPPGEQVLGVGSAMEVPGGHGLLEKVLTRVGFHGTPHTFAAGAYEAPSPARANTRQWPFPNATHFADAMGDEGQAVAHALEYGPNVHRAKIGGDVLDVAGGEDVRAAAQRLATAAAKNPRLDAAYYRNVASGRERYIDYEILSDDLAQDPDLLRRAGYIGVRYGDEVGQRPAVAVFDRGAIQSDETLQQDALQKLLGRR